MERRVGRPHLRRYPLDSASEKSYARVVETETLCRPGWSSERTLWVSRRERGEVVWTEVEADGGRPTGRRGPGSRDCFDGGQDPASPVDPDIRVLSDRPSQLRFLAAKYLEGP